MKYGAHVEAVQGRGAVAVEASAEAAEKTLRHLQQRVAAAPTNKSTLSHPRGATAAGKEAPAAEGLTLGPALIERTANAIEAVVRRHVYLAQVKEMFVVTDEPSPNLSFLDGSSVLAPTSPSSTRGPVVGGGEVRANAPGFLRSESRPAGGDL